jgi:hypothetical protein
MGNIGYTRRLTHYPVEDVHAAITNLRDFADLSSFGRMF